MLRFNTEKIKSAPEGMEKAVFAAINASLTIDAKKDRAKFVGGYDPAQKGEPVFDFRHTSDYVDEAYKDLFAEKDMRKATTDVYDMMTGTWAGTFDEVKPGEEIKFIKLPEASKNSVRCITVAKGFNMPDDWVRFNKLYAVEDVINEFRKKHKKKCAAMAWALLNGLPSSINVAYATDDVTTINNACVAMLEELKDSLTKPSFIITCSLNTFPRIARAVANDFLNPNSNNNKIVFPIQKVNYSTEVASGKYFVSVAGGNNKEVVWQDEKVEDARAMTHLATSHVMYSKRNFIIGEAKEHRRCSVG